MQKKRVKALDTTVTSALGSKLPKTLLKEPTLIKNVLSLETFQSVEELSRDYVFLQKCKGLLLFVGITCILWKSIKGLKKDIRMFQCIARHAFNPRKEILLFVDSAGHWVRLLGIMLWRWFRIRLWELWRKFLCCFEKGEKKKLN